MIKLTDLLEAAYIQYPEEDINQTMLQKGFKLSKPKTDPETGAISSDVKYLPDLQQSRSQILSLKRELEPFQYSSNENDVKIAKDINKNLSSLSKLLYALNKSIELQKKISK